MLMSDPNGLITATLSKKILDVAVKQANRSTIETFKTGAVLFDKNGNVVESGCSHVPMYTWLKDKRSVHAEDDVLNKIVHVSDRTNLSMLVYTLGKSGNPTYSSKPCNICAERLRDSEINNLYYLERCNNGSWTLNEENPHQLIERSNYNE
jgi:deoxycytidylate deaminase